MYRKWVLAIVATCLLSACTKPGPETVPSRTSSAGATATSSPLVAPVVEHPVSLGESWKNPCALLKVYKLEDWGFGDEEDGRPNQVEHGSACVWTAIDQVTDTTVTLELVAYPDHDILGETYKIASMSPETFKPFSMIRPPLPSAFVLKSSMVCSYVVGFSDRQGISVTYTRQVPFEDGDIKKKCAVPYSASVNALDTMRQG
jgi:hypothetical protein